MKIELIISSGQYETAAFRQHITATTYKGFCRRIYQLKKFHAVYAGNWAGWLNADIAIASPEDEWGDNSIIGGRWCNPKNGWIVEDPSIGRMRHMRYMSYQDAWAVACAAAGVNPGLQAGAED